LKKFSSFFASPLCSLTRWVAHWCQQASVGLSGTRARSRNGDRYSEKQSRYTVTLYGESSVKRNKAGTMKTFHTFQGGCYSSLNFILTETNVSIMYPLKMSATCM